MSEPLLNEDEIRDLLKQPSIVKEVGHLWEGQSAPYDLLQSSSKVKDKIDLADQVHKPVAVLIQKSWMEICGPGLSVEFSKHEMIPASEAIAESSVEKSLILLWSDKEKGLEGFFKMDRSLFFLLYGKILGGSGTFEKKGPLTQLEVVFFNSFINPMIEILQQGWQAYGEWIFQPGDLVMDQEKLGHLVWSFDGFRALFKIKVDEYEGEVAVLFPKEVLNAMAGGKEEEIIDETGGKPGVHDLQWSEAVREAIMDMPVSMTIDMGTIRIPLKQVIHIKPADELPLMVNDSNYVVYVRNRPMFRASIGTVGEQRAIQIMSRDSETTYGR